MNAQSDWVTERIATIRHFLTFKSVSFVSTSLVALLVMLLFSGCSGEPLSPEAQLRALLAAGEMEIESRDLSAVMERVAPDYLDARQRDWRQMRALLAGYFLRHPSIFVISQIDRIHIIEPGRAQVVVLAGLAGSAQEAAGPLGGWRGNLLRLDLTFKRNADEAWQLTGADWRPATREDFTE
ncbi:MAG: hypothetical protein P8Z77_09005 [Candidatus Thiodiazotropha sp.]